MSAMLCLMLVSSVSAMVLADPRVVQVMAEDVPGLRRLSAERGSGRLSTLRDRFIHSPSGISRGWIRGLPGQSNRI